MRRASRAGGGVLLAALSAALAGCSSPPTPAPKPGVLTGQVTQAGGKPVAGAEVGTEPASGFAVTDATGAWRIEGVAAGTWTVVATKTGYVAARKEGVALAAGGTAIVDLVLTAERGAIAGKVARGATPLAGAAVVTVPATSTATTAADGSYKLDGVAPGTYAVKASADGHVAAEKAGVQVQSGKTITVDFDLAAAVTWASACEECHLQSDRILADLAIDPPPEAPGESGSAGEG